MAWSRSATGSSPSLKSSRLGAIDLPRRSRGSRARERAWLHRLSRAVTCSRRPRRRANIKDSIALQYLPLYTSSSMWGWGKRRVVPDFVGVESVGRAADALACRAGPARVGVRRLRQTQWARETPWRRVSVAGPCAARAAPPRHDARPAAWGVGRESSRTIVFRVVSTRHRRRWDAATEAGPVGLRLRQMRAGGEVRKGAGGAA